MADTTTSDRQLGLGPDAGRTGTDTVSQAAGAGHVIYTYTQTVLEQPSDNIPDAVLRAAPQFPSHLATAQTNARHFNEDILPVMSTNVADLLSFSNTWSAFAPDMKQYAAKGDYATVTQGLQIMQRKIGVYAQKASSTHSVLTQFQSTITGDAKAMSADYMALTSQTAGLPAEISGLDAKIDAENHLIDRYAGMIAGGAAATLIGGVMVVGGLMTEVLSFGASTAVVVSGLLVAGGGVALIVLGSKGIDSASRAVRDATAQKARLNQELTSLKTYQSTVGSLRSAVENAVSAIGNLAQAWDYLYEDMNAVVSDLQTAGDTVRLPWFADVMDTADKDWGQVGSMAAAVQNQTANATYTTVDLSQAGSSLTDVLPAQDRAALQPA